MTPREIVLSCLQKYADRGIFSGFGARVDRNGDLVCRFLWHAPAPHRLRFERKTGLLIFVDLLPGIPYPSPMDHAVRKFVDGRDSIILPAHRRIDPQKMRTRCRNRGGKMSIEAKCFDGDYEYTATRAVKLVNEVFLDFLAGPYDAYMVEHFGAPEE